MKCPHCGKSISIYKDGELRTVQEYIKKMEERLEYWQTEIEFNVDELDKLRKALVDSMQLKEIG